ncbi:MAG TPA: hypothetical protein VND93_01775 [Myxococcales bacterium]|nr:hypothetical protein [Myxococcales bacterium]
MKLEPTSIEGGLAEGELEPGVDVLGVIDEEDQPWLEQRIGGKPTWSWGRPVGRAGRHTLA